MCLDLMLNSAEEFDSIEVTLEYEPAGARVSIAGPAIPPDDRYREETAVIGHLSRELGSTLEVETGEAGSHRFTIHIPTSSKH